MKDDELIEKICHKLDVYVCSPSAYVQDVALNISDLCKEHYREIAVDDLKKLRETHHPHYGYFFDGVDNSIETVNKALE